MTHHISAVLDAHPKSGGMADKEKLAECIGACFECSQACTACADACLGEKMVADFARCIRTDLEMRLISIASPLHIGDGIHGLVVEHDLKVQMAACGVAGCSDACNLPTLR